jgi:hypothetical protein
MSDYFSLKQRNNFFICQRILPRFSVDFVFILLCTFLEVDLVGVFFVQRLWKCDIWIAEFFQFYTLRTLLFKVIFHCSRFARASEATNFNHVKNQSRGTPRKLNVVQLSWRIRKKSGGQKMHRLDN